MKRREPVANDDYSQPCPRCSAPVGVYCLTVQREGFRQHPAQTVAPGTPMLRIHAERRAAVLSARGR